MENMTRELHTSRTTTVQILLPKLFCQKPFFGSDTTFGIAIAPSATLTSKSFVVLDNDSHGWTAPGARPNLHVAEKSFNEVDGLQFYGWYVSNNDINLQRLLRATFQWDGSGPDHVQAEVGNVHQCGSGMWGAGEVNLGVLHPSNGPHVTSVVFQVRDSGGWVGQLPDFSTTVAGNGGHEGTPPGSYLNWSRWMTNKSKTSARMGRFTVNTV